MAAVITVENVKTGFPTSVDDAEIQMLIDLVDTADACLDGANVPNQKQYILKLYAVRHMLSMQANAGRGNITSEHAPSGASRSYSAWKGVGVNATPYGNMLSQLDSSGCIVGLIENDGNNLGIWSIGRPSE